MNRQFFEFWGNFFINVAQGQKQLDDLSQWMKQGFAGVDDLTALFQQSYGLKAPESGRGRDTHTWQQAITDFQRAFAQFAAQWGWVGQYEHQQVLDKCVQLEKKVQAQQATITQLRDLLTQAGLGHAELFQHVNKSIKEQSDQFQALMDNIRTAGKNDP